VRSPEVDEVVRLVRAALEEDPRFGCFVLIVAATGMRRGEACALRWSDVDLHAGTVRIDESVISAKGGALVKGPKTGASIRRVALDAAAVEALRALKHEQARLASDAGVTLGPDAFVFSTTCDGALPPHPDAISHAFTRTRVKAGVSEDVHLHSLRHFHATAVDGVVSEAQKQLRLGWSTVQMARHYTDGVATEDRRAAEHVGRLLAAATSDTSPSRS
jgi:integrase